MNATKEEAVTLVNGILANYSDYNLSENKVAVVASPFPYIHYCSSMFAIYPYLYAAAQNCSEFEQGAYTGEVSAKIIASLDVKYVIIGHSERRQYFAETDELLLNKIKQAQKQDLIPIFCCGESLETREANEPIWAIGTGKTASPQQAQEIHAFIRSEIAKKYNEEIATQISILYGGSVNAKNAAELFACNDIDGGLVGGASLKADEFATIIKAMK